MKLRFTPRAVRDLNDIADYLQERSPAAALSVRSAIYRSLEQLLLFPLLGRQQTTEKIRKVVTPRYGYLIYYIIEEEHEEVVIMSVKHPAREREFEDE